MGKRQQIQEIPAALRTTLEKAATDYGALVRKVRWGDGPVFFCGAGRHAALGIAAAHAFETFAGWPLVARPAEVFLAPAQRLLRPRSVLLLSVAGGEWPEVQELATLARQRDCTVVALTPDPDHAIAKLADHVFLIRAEGDADSPAVTVCLHAALNALALEAARALKRPEPVWEEIEQEFAQLPEKLEWVFTQLSSGVRSLAREFAQLPRLGIVGAGFYQYPAWQAAWRLQPLPGPRVEHLEASEFLSAHADLTRPGDALLFLSGSRSKLKKLLHRGAAQARTNGARVLSLTDGNDRELCDASDLGVLVPALLDAPSSTLMLFMLEWLAMEALPPAKT